MPILGTLAAASNKGFASGEFEIPVGQVLHTAVTKQGAVSTLLWSVPDEVYTISLVCIGGGARRGGAGALQWMNDLAVTPGEVFRIYVGQGGTEVGGVYSTYNGGDSYISRVGGTGGSFCIAQGGKTSTNPGYTSTGGIYQDYNGTANKTWTTCGGGSGGGVNINASGDAGGNGAGGYNGNGGTGTAVANDPITASASGGGQGVYTSSASTRLSGGGTNVYGQGDPTPVYISGNAFGGSYSNYGGQLNGVATRTKLYGGSGGYTTGTTSAGAPGAVRIIWGPGRSFPSTLTTDQTVVLPY